MERYNKGANRKKGILGVRGKQWAVWSCSEDRRFNENVRNATYKKGKLRRIKKINTQNNGLLKMYNDK